MEAPIKFCVKCGVEFEELPGPCPDEVGVKRVTSRAYVTCDVLHYWERCPRCG